MANSMKNFIQDAIKESIDTKLRLLDSEELLKTIEDVARECTSCYENNGKIILAGNGGSAADAQHISAELVNQLNFERPALHSIALTTDTSILTAVGNDRNYEQVFSRQIEACGQEGDVFIGISTSGNSKNVIQALKQSRQQGIITIGLTGGTGGEMINYCDHILIVPSSETPRIQESHILIAHTICSIVEQSLFSEKTPWKQ